MARNAFSVVVLLSGVALSVRADDSLVRFRGGIGVIPVSRGTGAQAADGTFPDVVRNDVRGTPAAGQIWVIAKLEADVGLDGRIEVEGRGLLLGGGNAIGTTGNQSVRARLFCGTISRDSGLVPLEPNGDFEIDETFAEAPPNPCDNPALLILSRGGSWFAAGIPRLSDGDDDR